MLRATTGSKPSVAIDKIGELKETKETKGESESKEDEAMSKSNIPSRPITVSNLTETAHCHRMTPAENPNGKEG